MTARLDAPWLGAPHVGAVMAALGEAYFVGGCVRNALIGTEATDIDLATPLLPERVVERLEAAGLKAVPTGIEHGTVTAVAKGIGIEVTTFRADVETDGRRAVVRFTTRMEEDARRRDFTMNALYADGEGRVIDPLGGLPDLEARRVRFIGAAEERIREDYLRILRFFRFSAWYGRGPLDGAGLAACEALAGGVDRLARERVGAEVKRLLAAPDPADAVAAMAAAGILARVLPGADAGKLPALLAAERAAGAGPDWARRLVAIGGAGAADGLRLSRAETKTVAALDRLARGALGPAAMAEAEGAALARGAALVRAAWGAALPPDLEAEIARGAAAVFPLEARDLVAAGIPPGPALGAALAEARARWIASDFALDKKSLLAASLDKGQGQ